MDIFIYNLVKSINCTFKEALEMPYQRAILYLLLEEERIKRERKEMDSQKQKIRRRIRRR